MELEYKFAVDIEVFRHAAADDFNLVKKKSTKRAYILLGEEPKLDELRVSIIDDSYAKLCFKNRKHTYSDCFLSEELEQEIPLDMAYKLFESTTNVLYRDSYYYRYKNDDKNLELRIDIPSERWTGIVLAEIEVPHWTYLDNIGFNAKEYGLYKLYDGTKLSIFNLACEHNKEKIMEIKQLYHNIIGGDKAEEL